MSDDKKWVTFIERPVKPGSTTKRWAAQGSGGPGDIIGDVRWHGPWRKYIFVAINALLAPSCLRQIAEFCDEQTREFWASKRKVK
jgi:hypothetical protein